MNYNTLPLISLLIFVTNNGHTTSCPVPLRVGDVAGAAVGATIGIATTAISIAGDAAKVAIETPMRVVETVSNIHLLPELPSIPIPQISIKI